MILIHSTHEAEFKKGGIGAVLDGLLSAPSYLSHVSRTLVVGTMNTRDAIEMECLFAPRNKLKLRYFSTADTFDCTPALAAHLSAIEARWNLRLLYGTRAFGSAEHEIILVDPTTIDRAALNLFKYSVWQRFRLDCQRYEKEHEFDFFIAAAQPQFDALKAVLGTLPKDTQGSILCHEFMGLPLWYAAEVAGQSSFKGAYVAHDVPTVRALVEADPGHDTRFYNVVRAARDAGLSIDDVFGDQSGFYKHAMLRTTAHCDYVLAVGDFVVDELRFIDKRLHDKRIDLVNNGVPSRRIALDDARGSNARLKRYAQTLTGISPTFIFTHVTRMVVSKGLWRDLRVMEELDPLLAARGESAVLFMLSSVIPHGRSAAEAQRMARDYGWPREHREGWPDLIALEAPLWHAIEQFNAQARASKVVLINQFGFSRDRCGDTMPADMQFDDLRQGSDLEFGQSIYEPFGIAQLEPLPSGALCAVSDVCGCVGFAERQLGHIPGFTLLHGTDRGAGRDAGGPGDDKRIYCNILIADYTTLSGSTATTGVGPTALSAALAIGQAERDAVERHTARNVAQTILERLPRCEADKAALMADGYLLAQQMSWEVVAREQLLPAITR